MTTSRDLQAAALDCISEAACDMQTLALDKLRDDAQDRIGQEVDSLCIYTNDCLAIISEHESRADQADVNDLLTGQKFGPADWQKAMTAYAAAIAHVVISGEVFAALDALDGVLEPLHEAAASIGFPVEWDDAAPKLEQHDTTLSHFAHDEETSEGVMLFRSRQCDGCNAVAIKSGNLWLSYVWDPDAQQAAA